MTRSPKLFLCRKAGKNPNAGVYLNEDSTIRPWTYPSMEPIPRSLARLLAKRILQALEEK